MKVYSVDGHIAKFAHVLVHLYAILTCYLCFLNRPLIFVARNFGTPQVASWSRLPEVLPANTVRCSSPLVATEELKKALLFHPIHRIHYGAIYVLLGYPKAFPLIWMSRKFGSLVLSVALEPSKLELVIANIQEKSFYGIVFKASFKIRISFERRY
jgi:hypothetical protein